MIVSVKISSEARQALKLGAAGAGVTFQAWVDGLAGVTQQEDERDGKRARAGLSVSTSESCIAGVVRDGVSAGEPAGAGDSGGAGRGTGRSHPAPAKPERTAVGESQVERFLRLSGKKG